MLVGGLYCIIGGMIVHSFLNHVFGWDIRAMLLGDFVIELFVLGGSSATILGALLAGFVVENQDETELQK